MHRKNFRQILATEFGNYSRQKAVSDILAGITVAAVALPLALAFGVASGATAAAGLVTAIVSGVVIGALSGAPYQISGPTGAMSAVLILLAQRYGLTGVWIAGFMSGALLLVTGLLRLGRFISFIPAPVITGFTSGIAVLIAVGQFDNALGVSTPVADSALQKLIGYFLNDFSPNWLALGCTMLVVTCMLVWPKRWQKIVPSSLGAIIIASGASYFLGWDIAMVREIPNTLILPNRLTLTDIPWNDLTEFIAPALTITALGAVESLLCGAVASTMTGIRLQANQELIAQGLGNMLLPFVGGVPATAAIARTSVGIKSGGQTRLVSLCHAFVLLGSMFLFAPIMSQIPLAALAGVLLVTAWRMNEWDAIHFYFSKRFKSAIGAFAITMLATVTLDLTQAILIGTFLSGAIFLSQVAQIDIDVTDVNMDKLRDAGVTLQGDCSSTKVAYVYGPLFFAATGHFSEAFSDLSKIRFLILTLRGVPLIDTSGLKVLEDLHSRLKAKGGRLMLAGVPPGVMQTLRRAGMIDQLGEENIFWSADQAILSASTLSQR